MIPHARRRYGAVISLTGMAAFALAGIAITTTSANATPPAPAAPSVLAANTAAQLVNSRAAVLHASPNDAFIAHSVVSTREGLQYVPYDRTYKGLPVYGGDFVVVTNAAGQVLSTAVAAGQHHQPVHGRDPERRAGGHQSPAHMPPARRWTRFPVPAR